MEADCAVNCYVSQCFQTLQKLALRLYEQPLTYFGGYVGERSHRAAREKLMVVFCDPTTVCSAVSASDHVAMWLIVKQLKTSPVYARSLQVAQPAVKWISVCCETVLLTSLRMLY